MRGNSPSYQKPTRIDLQPKTAATHVKPRSCAQYPLASTANHEFKSGENTVRVNCGCLSMNWAKLPTHPASLWVASPVELPQHTNWRWDSAIATRMAGWFILARLLLLKLNTTGTPLRSHSISSSDYVYLHSSAQSVSAEHLNRAPRCGGGVVLQKAISANTQLQRKTVPIGAAHGARFLFTLHSQRLNQPLVARSFSAPKALNTGRSAVAIVVVQSTLPASSVTSLSDKPSRASALHGTPCSCKSSPPVMKRANP